MKIDVELFGELTRAQIVTDRRRGAEGKVDVDRFIDRFVETMTTLGK